MDLLSTIITAGVTSGIVTALLNWFIKSKERGEQRRWEIKREACLEALEIIDARFADYSWQSGEKAIDVDSQGFIETEKIRSCFNRLILACENQQVPLLFEKCLNLQVGNAEPERLDMNAVVELRNAIRKELGFGKELFTKVSWITNINWKRKKT
jgi:hypothetical protein